MYCLINIFDGTPVFDNVIMFLLWVGRTRKSHIIKARIRLELLEENHSFEKKWNQSRCQLKTMSYLQTKMETAWSVKLCHSSTELLDKFGGKNLQTF